MQYLTAQRKCLRIYHMLTHYHIYQSSQCCPKYTFLEVKLERIRTCFPSYTACLPPPVSCRRVASFPWEVVLAGSSQRRLPIWRHLPWSHWWWWGWWCCCVVKDWMGKALSLGTRTVFALCQCKENQNKTKTKPNSRWVNYNPYFSIALQLALGVTYWRLKQHEMYHLQVFTFTLCL